MRSLVLFALAVACVASATAAQPSPSISIGQTVRGELRPADPTLDDRGRARTHRFRARTGERLVAVMRSSAFDAYLSLGRRAGSVTEHLDADDDGGGGTTGTDARLRFTVPADGEYLLVAQSLGPEGFGEYTLSLQLQPIATTGRPLPIRVGQTVQGELTETDPVTGDDEAFFDSYLVEAGPGQRMLIEMRSTRLDSYLAAGRERGAIFDLIESDDDGGEDLDARLVLDVPESGPLVIRATSVGGQTGPYSLSVTAMPERSASSQPETIPAGERRPGQLDRDDPRLEDGSHFDYWIHHGSAGDRLRIEMTSDEFDTFLAVGTLVGESFEVLALNDDGPVGTHSLIEAVVPPGGVLIIRANSLTGGATGRYQLGVLRLYR